MGRWKLSKEEFERCKKEAVEKTVEKFFPDIEGKEKMGLCRFFEELFNEFMVSEREIYLEKEEKDKGNGYYSRDLISRFGKLGLEVPRTRNGKFRPYLLGEKYKRSSDDFEEFLISLISNGYSKNQIQRTLKKLELPYSEQEIEKIKENLKEKVDDFKTRQLNEDWFCMMIDGYHCQIKNKQVKDAVIYVILLIGLDGKKEIGGWYIEFGKENRTDWIRIFNDLISRGLKRVLIIVSDDFPGLSDSIESIFPKSDHQLCYVHLQRNIKRNMGKADYREFKEELKKIMIGCERFEEATESFSKLIEKFRKKYPYFMNKLEKNKERYFTFKKYPKEIQKYIYTTNACENINRQIEDRRIKCGGYFQSIEVVDMNFYLIWENLENGRWRKPIPNLKGNEYEIRQLFNLRFGKEVNQTQKS